MDNETRTYPTEPAEERLNLFVRFFTAPIEVRTYTNLLYLALSFPMGLFYFIYLVVGMTTGFALTIIWIGLPILALMFASSFGMAALERRLAIHLLGARVPPMTPQRTGAPESVWKLVQEFLANPVTWKGMAYLFLKLPLGVFTFALTVALSSLSLGLLSAPILYRWNDMFVGFWVVDTLPEALLVSAFGVITLLISLNVFNVVAIAWREVAEVMLGSEQYAAAPAPTAPDTPLPA
ncbi:MAG: sensor domain-containing protein [Acidobacteriota bacterium]